MPRNGRLGYTLDGPAANMIKELLTERNSTGQDENRAEILANLEKLGEKNLTDSSVAFEGSKFVLPANLNGNVHAAIKYLQDWDEAQNSHVQFSRRFPYRPWDVAAAFERALKRTFGTGGIGQATESMFGSTPPQRIDVKISPTETVSVPWGEVVMPLIDTEFHLMASRGEGGQPIGAVSALTKKKNETAIRGLLDTVEDELKQRSIYKGKAITVDAETPEPGFLDLSGVNPGRVLYAQDVQRQLAASLWTPIEYSTAMISLGQPMKLTALLEGPFGTGKSLAGSLTALKAVANGWTYIHVTPGAPIEDALSLARQYGPAVVWIEDVDIAAGAGQDRKRIVRVLEALDGVTSKVPGGLVVGMTTNHVDQLDAAALRPGRIDSVIHIGAADRPAFEGIVAASLTAEQAAALDYDALHAELGDLMPAFLVEATGRAVRYAVSRSQGMDSRISTQDVLDAGQALRGQIELVERARTKPAGADPFESALERTLERTLERAVPLDDEDDPHYGPKFTFKFDQKAGVTAKQKHTS